MTEEWKLTEKDPEPEGPYWIKATDSGEENDFWWSAMVKWDGCIELVRRFNSSGANADQEQLHICDLDQFIERLKALRDFAKKELGPRHGLYES